MISILVYILIFVCFYKTHFNDMNHLPGSYNPVGASNRLKGECFLKGHSKMTEDLLYCNYLVYM